MAAWEIKGREVGNCNCDYSGPCQFNALPTHGHCRGLAVFDIEEGFHETTRLDGVRGAAIFRWPGPIHEGKGEAVHIVDARATPEQREALLRILRGGDTDPGATVSKSSPRPARRCTSRLSQRSISSLISRAAWREPESKRDGDARRANSQPCNGR